MEPAALSVRVPGSTSNLGPGFDCLGLCLSLYLDVWVTPSRSGRDEVVRVGEPVDVAPEHDLLVRAYHRGRALGGASHAPARFAVRSEIPFGRGFGSSGAAVAAGLVLGARAAGADPRALQTALEVEGLALEGHPDNVIASLRGGCTLGVPLEGGALEVLEAPVSAALGWVAAWPATPLPTPLARRALPATVPFGDAVENPRRLALLLRGLERGCPRLVAAGMHDRLHERYRLPLIPGAAEALARARHAGAFAATISGAGSGVIALGPPERLPGILAALAGGLGPGAAGRVVVPVREGALAGHPAPACEAPGR